MMKSRLALPAMGGPPKAPAALRVSTIRQGVMGMKRRAGGPEIATGLTTSVKSRLLVFAAESDSCKVKAYLPATVGTPENSREHPGGVHPGGGPVVIPAGKAPVIVQVKPDCEPPAPFRKNG
jgi:hypothetical protein